MAELTFEQLSFEEEKDRIKVNFLRMYYFYLDKVALERIGHFKINKSTISFNRDEASARRKFNLLINEGFKNLISKISKRRTYYIHKNSGIPLFGCLYLGIVDKGTSMLELKPLTGCNMNCIFCSVDEGIDSKRLNDYLIEREYLVEQTKKLLDYKKAPTDIYINPHGEPLLYPEIAELCHDLAKLKYVNSITLITAATLLTKPMIGNFAENKKTKLNVSLHAVDEEIAKKLFGTKSYNIKYTLEMLKYASFKMEVIIAPVLLPGYNEAEMPKIIDFAKDIKVKVLIQKYLTNSMGRNPVKEESWDLFFKKLRQYEEETDLKLIEDIMPLKKTKELPPQFKLNEMVNAKIALPGRFNGEKLAVARERIISIPNCDKEVGQNVKIRIERLKYGIFRGKLIN